MTCPSCQERLLEYVYGLLDTNDTQDAEVAREVQVHLQSCAACQAALERALQQKQMLARASKISTSMRFTAPKVEPAPTPSQKPHRVAPAKKIAMTWYATAAGLLLAVLLSSGGVYWWGVESKWKSLQVARNELQQIEQKPLAPLALIDTEKRLGELDRQLITLRETWKSKEEAALTNARAQSTYLQVIAPPATETGNPTNLLVLQNSLDNQPQAIKKVDVNVLDETQHPINQQSYVNWSLSNQYMVNLPKLANRESNLTLQIRTDSSGMAPTSALNYPLQALHAEYVAHLVTDKPLYQPGETVFYRVLALEKATFRPVQEELESKFTLLDPDGKTLLSQKGKAQLRQNANTEELLKDTIGKPLQGVAAAAYSLPDHALSGEYTLTVAEARDRFAPQQVKFLVNRATPPRFNKDLLHLVKLSYLPGETVELLGTIKFANNNQPWAHGLVAASVLIDGQYVDAQGVQTQESYPIKGATDATGMLRLQFRLPTQIQFGQASVTVKLDREVRELSETWTQPLRIVLHRPRIEFYPEGGDLIAGVPNRVYFMMRNAQGAPIDGQAQLLDEASAVLAELQTFRDETKAGSARGMGFFTFTPKTQQSYWLHFPQSPVERIPARLPIVKSNGVVLHIDDAVLTGTDSINVQMHNVAPGRDLLAVAYCRGQVMGMQTTKAAENELQSIAIPIASPLGGVYRITIFAPVQDQQGWQVVPVAERLLYRQPNQSLKLQASAQPVNDHQVKLKIASKTEQQKPTPAYVTIVGVNQALISLADDKTARQLPTHFLLAQEVREPEELEHADFFLSDHPSAKKALDLLLGVQGWRRFKEIDPLPVVAGNDQMARSWKEAKPVIFDNRQEVLSAVEQHVREQLPKIEAKLYQQMRETEQAFQQQTVALQEQKQRSEQHEKDIQHNLASAETRFITAEREWQQFSNWYRLSTAALLAVLGTGALLTIILRRRQMPGQLLGIFAIVTLISFAAAGYFLILHFNQPAAEVASVKKPVVEQLEQKNSARDEKPPAAVVRPLARLQESVKEEGKAGEKKSSDQTSTSMAKGSLATRSFAEKPAPSPVPAKELEKNKVRSIPGSLAGAAAPSDPARQLDKSSSLQFDAKEIPALRGAGKALTTPGKDQNYYGQNQNNFALGNAPKQGYSQAALNRKAAYTDQVQQKVEQNMKPVAVQSGGMTAKSTSRDARAAASAKKDAEQSAAKDQAKDSPLGGRGLGGGGFGGGGLGGASGERGGLGSLHPFFVREYAWNRETQPDNLKAMPWTQTIYWNPLLVIPNGETTIPLELPNTDGTYRISVFGHGGDGRLGATSIIVKTPVQTAPLSLQTKLSTERAKQGDQVQLQIILTNNTNLRQNRVLAKIHLPDGVTLPPNFKLARPSASDSNTDEITEPATWSLMDKELTLSWDELPAGKTVRVVFPLICQKPGSYKTAGSRAYLENLESKPALSGPLQLIIGSP